MDAATERMPPGEAVPCPTMPVLTKTHVSRLRALWSLGRPAYLTELTGAHLDLMVHGLVQSVEKSSSASAVLTVTRKGVVFLNENRQVQIAAQRPHHELGERLAAHLRAKGMHTWENVEFSNPDWTQPRTWGVVRPDVYACYPELKAGNSAPAIYEVKVSRADFLADLAKPQKREAYAAISQAVYYCCPAGLIAKTEVPDGFGLLYEGKAGSFEIVKKARRSKTFVMHADTAMTLMVKRQVPLAESLGLD
jgi:hypothetical protein